MRLAAVLFGLCALGVWGRHLIVRSALGAAAEIGSLLSALGAAPAPEPPEEEDAPFELFDPPADEAAPLDEPASSAGPALTRRQRVYAEKRVDVGMTGAQVLAFANARQIPRGASVSARGGCPAGIRLRDVAGYGLGVADGDLLVEVNGVRVTERSEVVSLVLAARGREDHYTQALVLRPSTGCRQGYRVSIEQPYPTEALPSPEEDSAVSLTRPVP